MGRGSDFAKNVSFKLLQKKNYVFVGLKKKKKEFVSKSSLCASIQSGHPRPPLPHKNLMAYP